MNITHPASDAPTDYAPETIEMLASASAQVRLAAHTARHEGLEFTLEGSVGGAFVLIIQDPTRPAWATRHLQITMTRKAPGARPAHEVIHVQGHVREKLQVAQIPSRLRRFAEARDAA